MSAEEQPSERHLAATVGAKVDLARVACTRVLSEVHSLDPSWPVIVDVQVTTDWTREGSALAYDLEYALTASPDQDDAEPVFVIEASIAMGYEVPDDFDVTDEALDAFGSVNVAFSSYPYFRELVQSLTARAGLPSLTLGVLRSPLDGPRASSED